MPLMNLDFRAAEERYCDGADGHVVDGRELDAAGDDLPREVGVV